MKRPILAMMLASTVVAFQPVVASAAPAATSAAHAPTKAVPHASVHDVAWRSGQRWGGRQYGHRRHRGIGAGAIIGGIVASALIASAIREGRASDSDFERCEDTYRSFDRRSGTYIGHDGERHVCPYLN